MPYLNKLGDQGSFRTCIANANSTEPSLTTILTGLLPLEHGITGVGQKDAPSILPGLPLLSRRFKDSFIASPAVILHPFFSGATSAKYTEEFTEKWLDHDFILMHFMDVHDYRGGDKWKDYYKGRKEIGEPDLTFDIRSHPAWYSPCHSIVKDGDGGLAEAHYDSAAHRVDKLVGTVLAMMDPEDTIIVTGDHGESFGENGVWYNHMDLYDPVIKVPLVTNKKIPEGLRAHSEIPHLFNRSLFGRSRKLITSFENTWQTRYRITKGDNYAIYTIRPLFKRPKFEGDPHLLSSIRRHTKSIPIRTPSMLAFAGIS